MKWVRRSHIAFCLIKSTLNEATTGRMNISISFWIIILFDLVVGNERVWNAIIILMNTVLCVLSVSLIMWSGCGLKKSLWQIVQVHVFGEVSGGKKHRGKTPVVRVLLVRCPVVRYPAFQIFGRERFGWFYIVANVKNGKINLDSYTRLIIWTPLSQLRHV